MNDRTSGKSAQAEAQEIFRSWLNAVELFLKTACGRALLAGYAQYLHSAVRAALAAQIQTPGNASTELAQAVKDLRFEKRRQAKIQLHVVLFCHDMDDQLEREWVAMDAMAHGNVSNIKRAALWHGPSLKPISPVPPPIPVAKRESEARPTPLVPLGNGDDMPTIPVAYSKEALDQLGRQDSVPPGELFSDGHVRVEICSAPPPETRRAIPPPYLPLEETRDAEIEVAKDYEGEMSPSELDLIFEDFLKDR